MPMNKSYEFDRYVNGVLMAEGICISYAHSLPEACDAAARLASRGDVLILRANAPLALRIAVEQAIKEGEFCQECAVARRILIPALER